MLDRLLLSDGPNPSGPAELMQFGRFVGSWDLDVVWYGPDGGIDRRLLGEWHFGWALEGRAVADVWIVPRRTLRGTAGSPAGEYGMSLRFYDTAIAAWRSTWLGPVHAVVLPFVAEQRGDRMVLERTDDNRRIEWSFSDMTSDSFTWENRTSADNGATWALEQRFLATRMAILE